MRRLVALLVALAVVVGVLAVVDVVVRKGVEAAVAGRIEAREPGSRAVVRISSFPFLGRLATSGTVPALDARITGVTDGSVHVESISLVLRELRVDRAKLVHGEVEPLSIAGGQVVAVVSQASVDAVAHLPLVLGAGSVGVAGLRLGVQVSVGAGEVVIDAGAGIPTIRVPLALLDVLPCIGSGRVVPGALRLSCHFATLPAVLAGTVFKA